MAMLLELTVVMAELAVVIVELVAATEELLLAELAGGLSPSPPHALSRPASSIALGKASGWVSKSGRRLDEKSGHLLFILCSIMVGLVVCKPAAGLLVVPVW